MKGGDFDHVFRKDRLNILFSTHTAIGLDVLNHLRACERVAELDVVARAIGCAVGQRRRPVRQEVEVSEEVT